jgi:thiamine-monophosphate kinase
MLAIPLGPGPEFDRIRAIAERLGAAAGALGDDCATIPEGPGQLVVSTDVSIEGVHFRREWITDEEIGWRSAAGALSDLAAAGARPVGLLVALAVPLNAGETADRIMDGVGALVRDCGGVVLGGDLSSGPVISLAVTVLGRAERPVGRRGGSPGDALWVTGALGGSRAAVESWRAGHPVPAAARDAFARPVPRLAAGQWLAAHGATALIDLSDGLAGDVRHLAAASGVGAEVDLAGVPVHPAVVAAASLTGERPEVFSARGGEDYELLVAMSARFGDNDALRLARDCGLPLTRIGQLTIGAEVLFRLGEERFVLSGFDHFAAGR